MKRIGWVLFILVAVVGAANGAASGKQTANPLVDELESSNPAIRAKAAQQLGQSGDPSVVPALAKALSDPSTKVRRQVIVALSRLHTASALHALLFATKDGDPGVRTLAVRAAVDWYRGIIPSVGFGGMIKRSYRSTMQSFQGGSTHVSPGTPVDPEVISALEAATEDTRSIEAAREAAHGLGVLLAHPAVPVLVKAAHTPDADLATNALNSLSEIKDVSAGPDLIDLLDSPSKSVRQAACVTVGILRTCSAVPKLEQIYQNDADADVRRAALHGLAFIGDPSSYAIFTKALWSQNKQERTYSAEGLARARDPKAMADLNKRLQVEKNAGVRLAIRFAQTSIGDSSSLKYLVNSLSSRSYGEVAQSYLIELARRKNILTALYPYLHDGNADVRRRLCNVLAYSGDASSLPELHPLAGDRNGDVAAAALRAERAIRARAHAG